MDASGSTARWLAVYLIWSLMLFIQLFFFVLWLDKYKYSKYALGISIYTKQIFLFYQFYRTSTLAQKAMIFLVEIEIKKNVYGKNKDDVLFE